ncbi:MAG TPA: 50S ribosomal protein L10 [Planctomycetota bacterium]|nr:50S ribosomal protein L10 [Planctomycetota bacterium]
MPKKLNALLKKELSKKLATVPSGVLVNYQGLPSEETYALRKELNAKKIKMTVVKNSIAAVALAEIGVKDGLDSVMKGPVALCYNDDPVAVATALSDYRKKNKKTKLEIKGGLLDKRVITSAEVTRLAGLPSRQQLLAQLAGTLNAPITGLVQALAGVLRKPLYALNAAKDKLEKGGGAAA